MNLIKAIVISLVIAVSAIAAEESVLKVDLKADQVQGVQNLGSMKVEGFGTVKLTASLEGKLVVVQAIGAEGKVLGRAESTVGLNETPIYVTTPKGLKKLTVIWKGP
jgi:hypothetical protein